MKRIALCIGNDAYSILPALNCAIADATAMEKELMNLGFDTELRTDLDRTGLADAIFSFADKIGNYDAALIYYTMLDMASKLTETIYWLRLNLISKLDPNW